VPKSQRKKLDYKSRVGTFLGYTEGGTYKVLDPQRKKIIFSSNVVFAELDHFTGGERGQPELPRDPKDLTTKRVSFSLPSSESDSVISFPISENTQGTSELRDESGNPISDVIIPSTGTETEASAENPPELIPRGSERPQRERRAPVRFQDYDLSYLTAHSAANKDEDFPKTIEEAVSRPDAEQWKRAIKVELDALEANGTWKLVDLPPDRRPLGCKWVFEIKRGANGEVIKYKGRLVVKGYAQEQGRDFTETFAPVAKLTSVRLFLYCSHP
jgi:hypothetical protein